MKNLLICLTALLLGLLINTCVPAQTIRVGRLSIDVFDLDEATAVKLLTEEELAIWKLKMNAKVYREAAARNEAEPTPSVVEYETREAGRRSFTMNGRTYGIGPPSTRLRLNTYVTTKSRAWNRVFNNLRPSTGGATIYNPHVTGKKNLP